MAFFTRFKRPENPAVDFSKCEKLVAVEFAKEADINFLLARYKNTGSLYTAEDMIKANRRPQFGDFTGIPDYQESLDKMREALSMFGELPLSVRQRFSDDPVKLLEFLQDKNNLEEAVELGLVDQPEKVATAPRATEDSPPGKADEQVAKPKEASV